MSTTVSIVYRVAQGGMAPGALASAVAAVPIPLDVVHALGARVASDNTTTPAGFAVRSIVFSLIPSVTATATPSVNSNGHIDGVTVTAPGANYVLPPTVKIVGGLPPFVPTPPISGSPQYDTRVARARSWLKLLSVGVTNGGTGFGAGTTAEVVGQLAANKGPFFPGTDIPTKPARQAKVTVTVALGVITGVVVVDPGAGYVGIPSIVVTGVGTGPLVFVPNMGVDEIEVVYPGVGYQASAPPTVLLQPAYITMFPDGTPQPANQGAPFANLMTTAIADAVNSPVSADAPVVA